MNQQAERFNNLALFLFAALVVLFSITRYADYDLWWHLKLGESVLNTGKPFFTDTFSYTFAGKTQYAGEWLADLIIFLSFKAGGITGVNLLKALVLLGTFHFLYRVLLNGSQEKETCFGAAILTLIAVLFAIRFRLFVRPYIFSLLFVSFFMYILSLYRKDGKGSLLYLLPLAEVIWANMSVGAIFGPVIFFLYALDDGIRNRQGIGRNLAVLAGLFIATLATPETFRIYTMTLDLSSDPYRAMVGEYQPMNRQILWGFGIRYTLGFQVMAVGAACYFAFLGGWRNLYLLLLCVLFFAETLLQVRMVEFFALLAAPAFALTMERILRWLTAALPNRQTILTGAVAAIIVLIVPVSVLNNKTYVFGNEIKPDAFPEEALAFLAKENITGRMFNSYSFGGYIIWRAPDRKVFFDGRYRRLYDPGFYKRYTDMVENAAAWQAADQQFNFDYVLVEYDQLSKRFPLHLNQNPNWALVYWDNHSAVYLKRTPANQRVISACEYRLCKPSFYDFAYLEQFKGDMAVKGALAEIKREIALNPANQEPLLAKVFLLYNLGRPYFNEVLQDLETASKLKPDLAMKHSAQAYILVEMGQTERAKQEILKAVSLDPLDLGALELGNKLGMKMKLPKGIHP